MNSRGMGRETEVQKDGITDSGGELCNYTIKIDVRGT